MSAADPNAWPPNEGPRPRRWLLPVLVLGLGAAAIGGVLYFTQRTPSLEEVRGKLGRLTLKDDKGENLTVIDRQTKPEVWYRVTLEHVPAGAVVPLTCEWIAPGGRVFHRNRYETRPIDRAEWPTHARYQFGPDAPLGTWRVVLLLEGRPLHSLTFELRDGDGKQEKDEEKP